MTKIDAKYLTKVYKDGEYALKNCSLCVNSGEFLVIVGASGAGKSTLLKVVAGTEELSSGELYFDGVLAENIPMSKRSVSMAFQEYVLYPHMTVFDNLATPLKIAGEDEKVIYDKIMETLRLFGLEHTADVKPKHLSGGEQQRVALAKALLRRSDLVLLDEPISNVDEKSRWDYCRAIKQMKQMLPKSTFIYVTHNTREALYLADRIAVMRDGVILQIAPKDFIFEYPEHSFVLELMGLADDVEIPEFDEKGRRIGISSEYLKLCATLKDNVLTFADKEVKLDDEYLSRLLHTKEDIEVAFEVEKFSKTIISDGFSLVFEVTKNCGNYLVLKILNKSFILNKKTDLKEGEKIRLYYKIEDLVLYDGDKRLTCHYPLHRKIKIRVHDAKSGKIELFGKRIKLNRTIPVYCEHVTISEDAFVLSYEKGKCSVRVAECLDEEFINGEKLSHVGIKGADSYLSFIPDREVTVWGKKKVWLNIIPQKLKFEGR
ncbi:MAG: ABC transporter ATP-binding protein [Clostridia bacterium]|nr:ABC transporter ATP-binding protein [Clostridia bacterium]